MYQSGYETRRRRARRQRTSCSPLAPDTMAKSSRSSKDQKHARSAKNTKNERTVRNSRTTVSGPAQPDASGGGDLAAEKAAATEDLAAAFAFNPNKAAEYDPEAALAPP